MRVDLKTLQRTLRRKSIQIMAQQNNNSRIELIFSLYLVQIYEFISRRNRIIN